MAAHLEYISARGFNPNIKNLLRDYYTYGFKGKSDFDVSEKTFNTDWNRLNGILKDYAEWSEKKERKNRVFLSTDSQSMDINPFQRVYRFCGEDRPDYLYIFSIPYQSCLRSL